MTQFQLRKGSSSAVSSPTSSEQELDAFKQSLSNHGSGSDYATDGTDDFSAQNNSDPLVGSLYDSPTFVLPDIDELYGYDDDQTNVSSMSRISAAFVQFSPAIPPDQENDLARMGLSAVDAANVPNHVQCVTSVNFLSETSQSHPEPHPNPQPLPPSQVQVTVMGKKKSRHKKTIDQLAIALSAEYPPCTGMGVNLGMGSPDADDSKDVFSVRSEPFMRRNSNSGKNPVERNQFQRAPSHAHAHAAVPSLVNRKLTLQRIPPRHVDPPRLPIQTQVQTPKRTNSLPSPTSPDADECEEESVTSEVSRQSRMSIASAPTITHGRRLMTHPSTQQSATRRSYTRNGPPPTLTGRKAIKTKKSVFGKVFSNQVQADYDDDVLNSVLQTPVSNNRLPVPSEYGVEISNGDPKHPAPLRAKSDSQRSFSETSVRSNVSQNSRSSNRNGSRSPRPPSSTLRCVPSNPDLDNSASQSSRGTQASQPPELDDPDFAIFLAECHGSVVGEKASKSFGKFFRRKG
jgi:hypothetical protein